MTNIFFYSGKNCSGNIVIRNKTRQKLTYDYLDQVKEEIIKKEKIMHPVITGWKVLDEEIEEGFREYGIEDAMEDLEEFYLIDSQKRSYIKSVLIDLYNRKRTL